MTIADLIKSIVDSSKERMKSPIAGAYFLAFIFYNWRPILFLLFSEAKIEDKIISINQKYCCWGAILWPITISIIFTVGIPYLMMLIDKVVSHAKIKRKENLYVDKETELDLKLGLVTKELVLQAKMSSNKEKEDLLLDIETLNREILQLKETIKIDKNNFQNQTDEFNKKMMLLSNKNRSLNFNLDEINQFEKTASGFKARELKTISKLPYDINGIMNLDSLEEDIKHKLLEKNIISIINMDHFSFTKFGLEFKFYLEEILNGRTKF